MAHRRAKPIAPEEYNTITLATVALGRVSTSRPDMSDSARPFSLEFGPIRGAYVLCEQSSFEAQVPMPFAPFRLRMGRSDAHGWVLERDAGDIHDDPPDTEPSCTEKPSFAAAAPAPAKERMLLDAAETHTLYWCYGRENFERMLDAFELEPNAARKHYEGYTLYSERRAPSADFLKGLSGLDEPLRCEVRDNLSKDAAYYLRRRESDPSADVWVFDVTPGPLRTLYRLEFAYWYQVQALKQATPAMATLSRARELIRAAYKGLPDVDLDARADLGLRAGADGTATAARLWQSGSRRLGVRA